MADIAIFRINYKSDFILTLNSDAGWLTPFCIKFWTGAPSQAYFVGFDGTTYTHCAPVDGEPTKLMVQFDDHHLPIGDLKFQIGYHFTVADFPTSMEDEVINQASVIIEVDDAPAQVMLDLNGETAPEIEFSLPAYANEAQRIANEEVRIAAEQQRIANEDARIQAEETRQQNEQQRIDHETARVNEFATLKSQSQAATRDANDAATLANQKAQLAADKAALADDAATLANQKAQLAADKAALANNAAQLAADKAALAQQKAEYAQQQGSYAKNQGDYAKNQGNYAKEQGDTALADHQRAEADHGIAVDDHTQAGNDHTRAEADHGIAVDDHTQAGNDHTRAESDHGIAVDDHTQAGNDHTRAESDHGIAVDDHTQAGNDHTRAESDHTRAESDHAAVEVYVDSLGAFDLSKYNAVGGVLATYADLSAALTALNALDSKYKYGGMSFKFVQSSDNKYVQARCMAQDFTTDTTQWTIADEGVYVENPEFVYVQTDKDDKILWAIKPDGGIYYGAGVPQQVIDYINEKIAELPLDEYEDIVAFLSDYLGGDATLKSMLDTINASIASISANKVDKEEGKSLVDAEYADSVQAIENPEFMDVELDADDKVLSGRKVGGTKFENNDVELNGNATVGGSLEVDGTVIKNIEDPENRSEVTLDSKDKIVSYRKEDGTLVENVGIETPNITAENISAKEVNIEGGEATLEKATLSSLELTEQGMTDFQQALKDAGFNPGGVGDWSDYISNDGDNPLHIPEPRLALVNISGIESMPTAKGSDWPCVFEMWDNQGNYFKKNAIIDDQGNTTRMFPKHNFAIDLFDSEVDGDAFKLKVGDWVPQDSFHFKAQYTDFFRGISMIAYKIVQEVNNSRSPIYGNPWKKALLSDKTITSGSYNNDGFDDLDLQTDTGAKCIPDGFPCIVYLNGTFYGVFNWALKKSRDNYHQKKDNPLNIHLDGGRPPQMQPLDWTKFEVRNPSYLVYAVPVNGSYKYDADIAQAEIAGLNTGETALSWNDEDTYSVGDIVSLNDRLYLSKSDNNIGNNPSAASYGKKPKDVYSKSNAYWIEITYTNTVKQAVIGFNIACNEVNTLSGDTGKEYLSTHFDVDNLIDFYLCQLILADEDIYANYQWITYDGIKWWLTDYDKDRTFGQIYMCPGVRPASEVLIGSMYSIFTSTYSPFKFLLENYVSEIKTRYTELRSIIFTEEHIIGKIKDWMARIGTDNLKTEFERWPESPCNRDSKIDREHWEVFSANYSAGTADNYDNTAQYHVGDSCYYSAPGGERHTKFKCIKDSLGNPPITGSYNYIPKELGYYDSLWRVITFVHERIPIIDDYVNSLS